MTPNTDIRIFSGNAHPALAQRVCDYLGIKLGQITCTKFADGEIRVKIEESARGNTVYIIQPTCSPTNDNIMELLIIIDAFVRASVKDIHVILPYYGYARQDKKVKPREPISAALVARLIQQAGASHVTVCDIHSEQIQGFFDIPVDHLYAGPIFQEFFMEEGYANQSDVCVVSPDVSGVRNARNLSESLGASLSIIAKRRPEPNVVKIMEVIGDVKGKRCIVIDDMADTLNTLLMGSEELMKQGAAEVYLAATHAVLSNDATQKLEHSCVKGMVVLDTIPIPAHKLVPKLKVLEVAPLLGNAIKRFHENKSVSSLFDGWRVG